MNLEAKFAVGAVVESVLDRGSGHRAVFKDGKQCKAGVRSRKRGIVRGHMWSHKVLYVEVQWDSGAHSWDRPGTLREV